MDRAAGSGGELEGHGRENLIKGMNVTRTVGWFTSVYPVVLKVSRPEDTGYQIKLTKDSLRKVPNKGIGYGLLKHLREEKGEPWKLHPEIGFNYMGQYDEDMQQGSGQFELSQEEMGPQFSADEAGLCIGLEWVGAGRPIDHDLQL